jgi:hypothetical protein
MNTSYKLGRKARLFNSKIPHLSALMAAKPTIVPPEKADWTHGITDFGIMLNDTLGDCTCAAIYHAKQIWTSNVLTEQTENDKCVLSLYESACGYKPGDNSTDNGGCEQDVLDYCVKTGILLNDGSREKFVGFMEVDPRNTNDVKIVINEFGLTYIGFNVPNSIFDPASGEPAAVWTLDKNNTATEGGHAVILAGYDSEGPTVISWGQKFKMTWEFFSFYTDESYAIISQDWINSQGKTPLGLTEDELHQLMSSLR